MVENESLLRLTDVQSVVGGVSRATIYRWVDNGKFPAPLKPSGGVNLWKRSDIDRWIASLEQGTQLSAE
jgi:prophage regulatory protein